MPGDCFYESGVFFWIKFDDILTFLADGVLLEWQKIDSLETCFAIERHSSFWKQRRLWTWRNGRVRSGRPMRKYDGSCGITTVWPKRQKGMDDRRILKISLQNCNSFRLQQAAGEDDNDRPFKTF